MSISTKPIPKDGHLYSPSQNQLPDYARTHPHSEIATTTSGNHLTYIDASETAGPKGVMLLQDFEFLDFMSHFDRERVPERVVHAKGAGAYGYFLVTHDITQYTAATVFQVGKKTKISVRFSHVTGEMGSADSVRDPRGFAIKFHTEDGIWDLVGNNTPIFFVRDPILFPMFIHALKRNPATHLRDPNMFWDFCSKRPETCHQVMVLYSDRGIPDGFRHMNGYGSDTFTLVNEHFQVFYCKFHYKTKNIRNLFQAEADRIAGVDPNYFIRDLYDHIGSGQFPSWTLYVQVMPEHEAATCGFNPFDVTKVWYHKDYPLLEVGELILNRNPANYFAEVEQMAFNPANTIPGIYVSPDRMLQGRWFSYSDTQRHRLGANFNQLPVNASQNVYNYTRDGSNTVESQNGAPNYHPNTFHGPEADPWARALVPRQWINGFAGKYDNGGEDNYTQAGRLYRDVLQEDERIRMIDNIATNLCPATDEIKDRTVLMFTNVDPDFGQRLSNAIRRICLPAFHIETDI